MADECLRKAAPDEPIFVLRAQDLTSDEIVEAWAAKAASRLGELHPKVVNARAIAKAMREWPTRKLPD